MPDQSAPLVLRQPTQRLLAVVLAALGVINGSLALLPGTDRPGWLRALQVAASLLVLCGAVAQWLMVTRADSQGVQWVDQFLRRGRLPWDRVDHFQYRGYWQGLGAWTTDGRWVRILQLGLNDYRAGQYVAQLEAYRSERQKAPGLT